MSRITDSPVPAKKPVLVVVHQSQSTPARVGDLLEQRGHALDIRCPSLGDPLPGTLEAHAGAVIFGGPMSANDPDDFIKTEIDWISVPLKEQKPFLGICLGAQMLARNLGATVACNRDNLSEIGYFELEPTEEGEALATLSGAPWPGHVYHWHSEGFDIAAGATRLAASKTFPNQAFQYGPAAFGLQFHPEANRTIVESWTTKAAHKLTLPGAQCPEDQFRGWKAYDTTIAAWIDRFLAFWLATGPRG